jgi:TetR/AcrR family transcriptional regulator
MSKAIETARTDAGAALPARMAGEERRAQILRVAMGLFSRRGFRGTTTKEIAHEAGVSEAIIFRHFATKQELYSAILDYKACSGVVCDLRESVADFIGRKDDFAVFSTIARLLFEHHEHDTEFLRLLTHSALEGHELAEMFWDRNVRDLYDFLGGYVRARQRDGAMRDADANVVVRAFLGMVIHHSMNNTLWDKERRLIDIPNARAAEEFARILLAGVSARGREGGGGGRDVRETSTRRARKEKDKDRSRKQTSK